MPDSPEEEVELPICPSCGSSDHRPFFTEGAYRCPALVPSELGGKKTCYTPIEQWPPQ